MASVKASLVASTATKNNKESLFLTTDRQNRDRPQRSTPAENFDYEKNDFGMAITLKSPTPTMPSGQSWSKTSRQLLSIRRGMRGRGGGVKNQQWGSIKSTLYSDGKKTTLRLRCISR